MRLGESFQHLIVDGFDRLTCSSGLLARYEFCSSLSGVLDGSNKPLEDLWSLIFDPEEVGTCQKVAFVAGMQRLLSDEGFLQKNVQLCVIDQTKLKYKWDQSIHLPQIRSADERERTEAQEFNDKLPLLLVLELFRFGEIETSAFENQVGGHKGDASMMQTDDCILKPHNIQEWLFYQNLMHLSNQLPMNLFPSFRGRLQMGNGSNWLKLENLCINMQNPSILDLKVGSSSMGHTKAGMVKHLKQKVVQTISTSSNLGFRVAGLKIFKNNDAYDEKDKRFCLALTEKTIHSAFREFLSPDGIYRIDFANQFLECLRKVRCFIEKQTVLCLNSSSLLFLYDAKSNLLDLKMIDFAHCYFLPGEKNEKRIMLPGPMEEDSKVPEIVVESDAVLGGAFDSAS